MTIMTSSVLADSSSGAFLRPHRLWGHRGCGRWLTGSTRTERRRTDMGNTGRRHAGIRQELVQRDTRGGVLVLTKAKTKGRRTPPPRTDGGSRISLPDILRIIRHD